METTIATAATPRPRRRAADVAKALIGAALTFTIHLFVMLLLVVFFTRFLPECWHLFEDHNIAIPEMLAELFLVSRWAIHYWYLFVLAFIALNGPIALGVQFLPDRLRWVRSLWFSSFLLFAIAVLFYGILCIYVGIRLINEAAAHA